MYLEATKAYGGVELQRHSFFTFLFLSFRRVLNVICSFLGNSPASEF